MFHRFARWVARMVGSPQGFTIAFLIVLSWAASGPFLNYSEMWQLAINTGTTIVTFLVVFLVQYTQNHDTRSLHVKLDEVIRAVQAARNELIDADKLNDQELAQLEDEMRIIAHQDQEDSS